MLSVLIFELFLNFLSKNALSSNRIMSNSLLAKNSLVFVIKKEI